MPKKKKTSAGKILGVKQSPGKTKKELGAKSPGTRLLQTAMLQLGGNSPANVVARKAKPDEGKSRLISGRSSLVAKALAVAVRVYVCTCVCV